MNEFEVSQQVEQELIEMKDNSGRAKVLLTVFTVVVGLTLIGLLSGYNELKLLRRAQLGAYISQSEVETSDMIQRIVGLSQIVLYITSVVVFLNWFRRAYENLHRAGANLRHKESMAIWAWAIPIVWFYRPVQIMTEIWNETQAKIKMFDSLYVIRNGGLIIGIWWTFFILSNFVGRYVIRTAFKQDTIEQLIEGSKATFVSDMLQVPEALFVMLIVYKLSKMEAKLTDEVKKSAEDNRAIVLPKSLETNRM